MKTSAKYFYLAIGPVATSWLALCWMCDSLHEQDVHEESHSYVAQTSNDRVILMEWSWWVTSNNAGGPGEQLTVLPDGDDYSDTYCSLLPQCEALRTCNSGFPITTGSRPGNMS